MKTLPLRAFALLSILLLLGLVTTSASAQDAISAEEAEATATEAFRDFVGNEVADAEEITVNCGVLQVTAGGIQGFCEIMDGVNLSCGWGFDFTTLLHEFRCV